MTPFGRRLRQLRAERGITQKYMAEEIGVSAAYLSALEHGRKGVPSWTLTQNIIGFFNIIWDEAEELQQLAGDSHPRVTIDTCSLSEDATYLINLLNRRIDEISPQQIRAMIAILTCPPNDCKNPTKS